MISSTDLNENDFDKVTLSKKLIQVDFVKSENIKALTSEWQDLYQNSAEPNPCYLPIFAQTLFSSKEQQRTGGVLTVRISENKQPSILIGLLPIDRNISILNGAAHLVRAQYTPFSASTTPLIHRGFERITCEALLDELARRTNGRGIIIFNEFRVNGSVGQHLTALLKQRNQRWYIKDQFERPIIDVEAANSFEDYIKNLKGRTRQTIKRKWRQLEKLGVLTYTAHSGDHLKSAMQEFLELEERGWKGRAGTAMVQQPLTKELALTTLCDKELAQTRIEALRLDGKPIAMSIQIGAQDAALHFKPTYDENYSKYSPGMLLHYKTIEALYRDDWATSLDAAVKEGDKIGAIWRERRTIGQLVFAAAPSAPSSLLTLTKVLLATKQKLREAYQKAQTLTASFRQL